MFDITIIDKITGKECCTADFDCDDFAINSCGEAFKWYLNGSTEHINPDLYGVEVTIKGSVKSRLIESRIFTISK